jgi:hypothetical protein
VSTKKQFCGHENKKKLWGFFHHHKSAPGNNQSRADFLKRDPVWYLFSLFLRL